MSPETPPISVVMAVYNGGPYLREAVDSILHQTYPHFELIVVNDGSTDGSLAILEEAARDDARVKVISQENSGVVAAANRGLGHAHGTYIARMDADDVSVPDRFEKQIGVMKANPDLIAVSGNFILTDPDGRKLLTVRTPESHEEIDAIHISEPGRVGACHAASMIRRDKMEEIGGYREGFPHAEDRDLLLRLAEVGELRNIDQTLYLYRQHFKSVSYENQQLQRQSAMAAIAQARQRRGLPTLPDDQASHPTENTTPGGGDVIRRWAWTALSAGYPETARHYALKYLRQRPFEPGAWRLLYCALRGR